MPYVIVRARGSQPDISVEGPDRIIDKLSELGIDQVRKWAAPLLFFFFLFLFLKNQDKVLQDRGSVSSALC